MQSQQTRQLFNSLGPVNGKLSGNAARGFLLTSNLPTHSLKDIWTRSDQDKDGQLTFEEFTTALQLIQSFKRGLNAAAINSMRSMPLPPQQWSNAPRASGMASRDGTMSAPQHAGGVATREGTMTTPRLATAAANWSSFSSEQVPPGQHTSPMKAGSSLSTVPASISNEMWVVDLNSKKRYLTLFNRLDSKRTGSVPGAVLRPEFMKSGLSGLTLSLVWKLSDISKTGSLSADEFCLAMYLIENAQRGKDPPNALTPALVPPQYRHFLLKDMAASSEAGSTTLSRQESIFTKATFENKKLENFNKGEQELERRRLDLKERERKAQENKAAELAAAQELHRQKAELQARRQLEFQRQRTKSLEVAAQMRQQEEEAQKTLYRNKMETWAVNRKQQLQGELSRLQELTTGLRTRKLLLDKELGDLLARCARTKGTVNSIIEEKTQIVLDIEKLAHQRHDIAREVNSARLAVQSSQSELATVTNDKLRQSQHLRARRNPDEVMMSILEDQEKAKQSLISLKTQHSDMSRNIEGYQTEMHKLQFLQPDVAGLLAEKETELQAKQHLLEELTRTKELHERAEKDAQAREKDAQASMEKTKQQQLSEKMKWIEESLKKTSPEEDFAKDRQELTDFNEFLSAKSEEANQNIKNAALSKQLANAALQSQRGRLKKIVEIERQRHDSENDLFYARTASLMKTPPRKIPKAPTVNNLICLDTPPRPRLTNVDFMKDLAAVLAPSGQKTDTCRQPDSRQTDSRQTAVVPQQQPVSQAQEEEEEWRDEDYGHSIYMNVDPSGILNSRVSPKPPAPDSPKLQGSIASPEQMFDSASSDQFYDAHDQDEEHIYALASSVVKDKEVLFQVEALVDYIGTTVDELSFPKGSRLSVYEERGAHYLCELDNKTGLVDANHVERCEWIYSEYSPLKEALALYDYQSSVEGDLCFVVGDVITITEDLGEWFKGNVDSREGIFPGNFVRALESEYRSSSGSTAPPASILPAADIKPICTGRMIEGYCTEDIELEQGDEVSILAQPDLVNVYIQNVDGRRTWIRADLIQLPPEEPPSNAPIGAERIPASLHCYSLYPYTAQNTDELNFKGNDIITITEQSDPHWWIGRLGSDVGVLPSNYVEQINDHETWETVLAWNANLSAEEGERTRQEAIHELISTEKTYIDDLLLVVEVFYNPLCSVATDEELSIVFVNWQQLILCNARLFRALYNNSDINSFETVGAVFLEEIDSLIGPYTKFCSSQRQAMAALQNDTSAVFKAKEAECAGSPKVGKLPLSTFLLKPMQRITKYPLLIKKILQHTRDTHPDYQPLKSSLTRTEYLLTSVNEAVRDTTRLESLQNVFVKCLSDEPDERVVLNAATNCLGPRKLVQFGAVSKGKGSKELFAVLFNDMFWLARVDKGRYGNKPVDLDARDFDSIKFEQYREPFMLYDIIMTENFKNPSEPTIQFTHRDKQYSFYCASGKEAADWTENLHEGIRHAALLHQSQHRNNVPDPTVTGIATLTLRIVEGLELAPPADDKPTSVFVQASLHGHVQRSPVGPPKWDHTMHFLVQDVASDKVNISLYKANTFSPNVSLGKFDLSIQKLLKSGGLGPWNKRLILTDTNTGMVNVSVLFRYHGNR